MKHSIKLLAGVSACLTLAFITAPASAAAAYAPDGWYVGGSGDLTWLHSNTGGGGNVDLGYRFNDVRAEAEAGYHGIDGTHYFTYMGNLYYDFNSLFGASSSGWHIAPYVGAGLGYAAVNYGDNSFSNTFHHHDNTMAYQGMAGLTFTSASMPNTDWSVGYRYLGTDSNNLGASNLELGVRFHF